eukprot:INCI2699.1.p1 GENE.INCI2699.1~~INCI2699.1.p1  ORF type:complete len:708 (-),score=62.64 INCI2699.1:2060-4183(-)
MQPLFVRVSFVLVFLFLCYFDLFAVELFWSNTLIGDTPVVFMCMMTDIMRDDTQSAVRIHREQRNDDRLQHSRSVALLTGSTPPGRVPPCAKDKEGPSLSDNCNCVRNAKHRKNHRAKTTSKQELPVVCHRSIGGAVAEMLGIVAVLAALALNTGTVQHNSGGPAPLGRWANTSHVAKTCNSTAEPGRSRRDCADSWFNNVTSPEECEAKCCALGPSHPAPFPNDGCIAWSQNNYAQCFLCMGSKHPDGPPASQPANCTPGKGTTACSTGVVTAPPPPPRPPAPATGPLGAEASPEYFNFARLMRWPAYPNNTGKLNVTAGELSQDGWPNRDCVITVFDLRPTHAWAPPLDDPEARQRNLAGAWDVAFQGMATLTLASGSGAGMRLLPDVEYNATSNVQRQTLVVSDGRFPDVENLLILNFSATRLNESASTGSGFRNLQVVRRNASAGAEGGAPLPLFTDNWARAHRMYDHTRWMGVMDINDYGFLCGGVNAAGCSVVRWEDRQLPSFAFQDPAFCPGCRGLPWEHVLLAANELGRDVWINVPVSASAPTVCRTKENGDPRECLDADDPKHTYEYELAQLFLQGNEFTGNVGLDPGYVSLLSNGGTRCQACWNLLPGLREASLAESVSGSAHCGCQLEDLYRALQRSLELWFYFVRPQQSYGRLGGRQRNCPVSLCWWNQPSSFRGPPETLCWCCHSMRGVKCGAL